MEQERIWNLFARKMAGEASEEELQELHEQLDNIPDLQFALEIIACIGSESVLQNEEAEQAYLRMLQKMKKLGIAIPSL